MARQSTKLLPEVRKLVARFQDNRDAYTTSGYNETQLRREFVDPLFTDLGWDVANTAGYAEAYKDVVHEDAIKIGGATKAPDYCFRVGGTRKFFVETKRPATRIKDDPESAYQLRRYAWSGKLPLSILTNFAELAVYDCRVKPDRSDPASTARILYLTCEEYETRWQELAGIFGKESVLKGSFDRYAESTKAKRGTAEVDDAFLKEIESWRDLLARNLALRNPELSQRELNFAVQRTIDRLIFLRICEDRGIEHYGALQALLNGENIYGRLSHLFRRADERYNSGLFHFRQEKDRPEPPDELTLALTVDDKVLKDIIRRLYYPDSPYEFSVLPADILGQVYEQFLGKVIRLTAGHRAKVEEKPEVRKAGGVYYTPTYIVDYIVEHTVGKLLEGKSPQEVGGLTKNWRPAKTRQPIRVLDPACGSGSFLLGAYQYLLDWYRDRYIEHGPEVHAKGRN
ncbi:MAG: type I restriction endonuclease, partial [Candidatus Bipolaricaulota bacterium]